AVGATRTTTITYTITDNEGGTDTATVTVTVTGTNDAPVSTPLGNITNDDADVVSVDVSGSFSDPDATDVLTFSATGLPPGLGIDPASGVISGTIAPNASVTGPYTVIVTATDPSGATTSETYTWTVNNPAPDAVDDVLVVSENATGAGDVIANDSDPDGDTLVVSAVNGVAGNVGAAVAGSNGGTFTVAANGSYSFDPSGDFDDLAVGATRTTTITYTITDNQGGTDTATVTVTVTGTNDAPVSTPLGNITNNDADVVSVDVSGSFSDPDATDVLTFSATGLPPGLTIDPASGVISGTIAPNASVTGPYTVIVTATDPSGATTSETYTWTVNNPAPDAVDDVLGVLENATGAGDVLGNDSDPDGDTLVVSAVNGVAGNVGNAVAGSNGGTFAVAANGSYSFDPSGDFDDLAVGATRTATITYAITDNQGGTDTATVTVTVTGTNDAPVAGNDTFTVNEDGSTTIDLLGNDFDTDGDGLTVVLLDGQPVSPGVPIALADGSGVVVIDATGQATFSPAPDFNGPVTFTYGVDDGHGGTSTAIVDGIVVPVNDPPIAMTDVAQSPEGDPVVVDVLANDTDIDGDSLVVVDAASPNGTVVINPDGTITFTPDPSFSGVATVTYTVSDGNGGQDVATVLIDVDVIDHVDLPGPVPVTPPLPLPDIGSSLAVTGVVVDTVNGISQLNSIAGSLGVDNVVVAAANGIQSLGGIGEIGADGKTISSVLAQQELSRLSAIGEQYLGLQSGSTWDVRGLTGFSLRFQLGADGAGFDGDELVVESLVRERVLILHLGTRFSDFGSRAVEYRVTQSDGRPLPAWLDRVGRDVIVGQRPASVETLQIKVTAVSADGASVTRNVTIEAVTGEIQPLASTNTNVVPNMFSDELHRRNDQGRQDVDTLYRALRSR
ncbi:MAG: tandem-95 repeat protein, partial [Hyphomicrobiaceae bacterium]|nr:tandem-95 repeat protein [Hyphomicrobiaceae bacterium]